jgi:ribonuclease Y
LAGVVKQPTGDYPPIMISGTGRAPEPAGTTGHGGVPRRRDVGGGDRGTVQDQREIDFQMRVGEADRRDDLARQRGTDATERDRAAVRRADAADSRAVRADERARAADWREAALDQRESALDQREAALDQREIDAELRNWHPSESPTG